MPIGHWLLLELDPVWMKRIMSVIIASACIAMLAGYRYRQPMSITLLLATGACAGIVFGGTYIALVAVVAILLGPYDKVAGRTLYYFHGLFLLLSDLLRYRLLAVPLESMM